MADHFSTHLDVTIRPCRREHVHKLEWFGMFRDYRDVLSATFERQESGEAIMLVAETNDFPIGQLWIDLVKKREDQTAVLSAFRVLPPFQGMGIGSRLLASAERMLREMGFSVAEIGVEKDNPAAKRLYERTGYEVVCDNVEEWNIVTPDGRQIHETAVEWIMHKAL